MSVFINEHTKRKEESKEKLLTLDCGWLGTGNNKRRQDLVGFIEPTHTRICTHTHTHMHTHTHTSGEKKSLWERKAPLSTRLSKLRAGLSLPLCPQASVREWVPSSLEKPTHSSLLLPWATDLTDIGWGLKPGAWDTLLQCLHLDKHLKATKYKQNMRD